MAAVAAGITLLIDSGLLPVVVAAALVLLVLVGLVKRVSTTYSITNQRLRIRRGIIARKVQQTRLERVQNVNTEQSVLERVLQVGTVDFDTAGTTDSDFSFRGVSQPEKVMAAVDEAQREHAADPTGLGGQPTPPDAGAAAAASGVAMRLGAAAAGRDRLDIRLFVRVTRRGSPSRWRSARTGWLRGHEPAGPPRPGPREGARYAGAAPFDGRGLLLRAPHRVGPRRREPGRRPSQTCRRA